MKDAADYLTRIKALIVANLKVVRWSVIREEAQGKMGLFRCRLTLCDGSLLEIFELFQVEEQVQVIKYSFHWQNPDGRLRKRWDNAAHHPEVSTAPFHVHYGEETNVAPYKPVNAEEVLAIIAAEITNQEA
jgi:hypothetical protein